jgi:hypothetical protein
VVGVADDRYGASFEVVAPNLECFVDGEQFFVVSVVVELGSL